MTEHAVIATTVSSGSAEIVVAADANRVYALVSDVTGYARFSPENLGATWLHGASAPTPGARFRSWNAHGRFRWFTHCEIERAEPGREFAFRVIFPPPMVHTRWSYRIETLEDGRTKVIESWALPAPLGPLRRAMLRLTLGVADRPASLTAGAAETLERLRAACEDTDAA